MRGKSLYLLLSLLLLWSCSKKPSDSNAADDTLPQETLDSAVLLFDFTGNSGRVAVTFKLVPLPEGRSLWVSECEITACQYAAIMDSAYTASRNPQAVNWYQAALFANALSVKSNRIVDSLRDSLSVGSGFAFAPVYAAQRETLVTVSSPRILISPFICALDLDSLTAPEVKQTVRETLSVSIFACCTLQTPDTGALSLFLSVLPDSIALPDTALIIFPNEYKDKAALTARLAPLLDTMPAVFFKHVYGKPGQKPYIDTAGAGALCRPVRTDSLWKRMLMAVFYSEVPPDSLRKGAFAGYQGVVLAHPDTLILRPDSLTFSVRVWPEDPANYGFRLPTEEEWEAVAACNMGLEYSTYSGKLTEESSIFNSGAALPAPGDRRPNPFGLYDFTGNLFEWTADWWSPDPANPGHPRYFPTKVIKGGCFTSPPEDPALKVTGRYAEHPDSLFRQGDAGRTGCRVVIDDADFWDYFKR